MYMYFMRVNLDSVSTIYRMLELCGILCFLFYSIIWICVLT